jgi:radical SAM protein with 4Fe4S-binding SPASM domain
MDFLDYLKLPRMFFNRGMPSYLIFFITPYCNSRCKTCFYWRNIESAKKRKVLSLEEIDKITKKMGYLEHVTLSGGEPFLRKEIVEICRMLAKNNDVRYISIPTNGLQPQIIEKKVREILTKCPHSFLKLTLSIDGVGKKHDYIRGVKGNFKKLMETHERLMRVKKEFNNIEIIANTCFSKYNEDDIEEIHRFVKDKFKIDQHSITLARGDTRERGAKDISMGKYKKILERIEKEYEQQEYRSRYPFRNLFHALMLYSRRIVLRTITERKAILPCRAGEHLLVIYDNGDVYPCELLDNKMGNLREMGYSLRKILKSKKARDVLRFIKKTKCFCSWECHIQNDIIFNKRAWPNLLKIMIGFKAKR